MITTSVFHEGERAAQERAGLRAEADRVGAIVRDTIPPAAAAFLAERPMLFVAGADERDRMWASLLTGRPGFLRAGFDGEHEIVSVAARPLPTDPLAAALTGPAQLGAIAIDPSTRRRMRINGVAEPVGDGLRILVDQAYANCPKYLQRRELLDVEPAAAPTVTVADALTARHRAMIGGADTFFIATSSATGDRDASHRGGNPGFVRVRPDGRLSWPDYPGNAMMMTIGNLEQVSSAGLLFLDWSNGTTLQLTGRASTDWAARDRAVVFTPEEILLTEQASPLRWSEPEYSRFNPD
ncbi:MAG TPA: pyridoxamine 5'-phosphate oxidase family protein [Pseudonocardiaceae bacterium]|jgi:hypothetical protein|nr:pyridoxamine 5'-phosphate oxidase family protein [Pseudonocardiaceae bacterium]